MNSVFFRRDVAIGYFCVQEDTCLASWAPGGEVLWTQEDRDVSGPDRFRPHGANNLAVRQAEYLT